MKTQIVCWILGLCFASFSFAAEYETHLSPNLYVRLGISQNATASEIKQAYRKLALKLHPDRNPGKEQEVLEPFQKIQEAYETLSDLQKRNKFDSAISSNSGPLNMSFDRWLPENFNFRGARDEILSLIEKHPKLQNLADYVLNAWILKQIPEEVRKQMKKFGDSKGSLAERLAFRDWVVRMGGEYYDPADPNFVPKGSIWMLSQSFYLWPTDMETVEIAIKTENPFLLRQIVMSMLMIPGWEKYDNLLLEIISKNNKIVNFGIAEFFYHPQWVNERGAKILSKFIELGYADAVARSLGLAGGMPVDDFKGSMTYSKAWYELPEGIELMKQLILAAGQSTLDRIDRLQLDSDSAPWANALRKLPEFRHLSYISTAQIKTELIASDKKPKLLGPSNADRMCKSYFR